MKARLIVSNGTTMDPFSPIAYGIRQAAEIARNFKLSGIEILPRRRITARWVEEQVREIKVVGIHGPWWWHAGQFDYNQRASLPANAIGFLTVLSQPPVGNGRAIQLAKLLEVDYFIVHSDLFYKVRNPERVLSGLPVCIENNIERQGYEKIEDTVKWAERLGAGIVLDTCHLAKILTDINDVSAVKRAYRLVRPYLRVVHLGDYNPNSGRDHLIPGLGKLMWIFDLLSWLGEDNYDGVIVIEIRHPGLAPRKAIESSLSVLSKYGIEAI